MPDNQAHPVPDELPHTMPDSTVHHDPITHSSATSPDMANTVQAPAPFAKRLKDRLTSLPGLSHFKGGGLKAMALKGSAWTMAGYGASQALRLASNLILTRLLFPEAFGLMAIVSVFMTGLAMFSDVGIGPSIIQNKRGDDPVFLNTAWTIQIIRGFLLWLAACLIAYPVSLIYGEPLLAQMLPVVGITAAISGFQTTAIQTANRHLMLGRVTLLNFINQALGITVMVTWAWIHPTVWALVGGGVVSTLISTVMGYALLPGHPHRLTIESAAFKALTSFGKWIFVATAIGFLSAHIDKLTLGFLLDFETLGIYSIAIILAEVPTAIFNTLSTRIYLPVVSKHHSGQVSTQTIDQTLLKAAWAIIAMCLLLVLVGPYLVLLLWDSRYADASWILPLFIITIPLRMAYGLMNNTLIGHGDSFASGISSIIRLVAGVTGMSLGYHFAGVVGLVIGISASPLAGILVLLPRMYRLHIMSSRTTQVFLIGMLIILGASAYQYHAYYAATQVDPVITHGDDS